ncbi:MAG TPA: VWA domain-containing protein [Bryobacteraceae bacterium]|nr:VWA domain-containing protein [Bryobacteraceae bacterium]
MSRWLAKYSLLAAACTALSAQQPTVFRANVNLVHVIATVKNQSGQLVGALQKSDFEVFDNGVRQEIAVFERQTGQPVSISLLIDTSGSTAKDLKYEIDSAARFLHALLSEGNPADAVALYSFDYQVTEVRSFTHNYASLEAALKLVHGSGGTSLYDAIYLTARALEPRQGRKVIVIVTDGGNTTSSVDIQKALKAAQFADAVMYPVVDVPITNDAGRNTGGENALTFMARGTGGRTFFPSAAKELDKAFADIISELRTQYFLGFYPHGVPPPKSPFHSLEVRVDSPDLRVSARNGYYGESETSGGSPDASIAVAPTRKKKP